MYVLEQYRMINTTGVKCEVLCACNGSPSTVIPAPHGFCLAQHQHTIARKRGKKKRRGEGGGGWPK